MKKHRFWAWAGVVCMMMAMLTGYKLVAFWRGVNKIWRSISRRIARYTAFIGIGGSDFFGMIHDSPFPTLNYRSKHLNLFLRRKL